MKLQLQQFQAVSLVLHRLCRRRQSRPMDEQIRIGVQRHTEYWPNSIRPTTPVSP